MITQGRRSVVACVVTILLSVCVASAQGINSRGLLNTGDTVSSLRGFGIDGKPLTIDFRSADRPTVIYVVKVTQGRITGFGKQNEANFAAIVAQAGSRFNFVFVVPDDDGGLTGYLREARTAWGGTPVTVLANVPDDVRQAYSIFAYPQTLVISPEGRVLESFQGAYTNDSLNAKPATIEKYFGIRLPNLRTP